MPTLKQLWDEHNKAGKPLPMVVNLEGKLHSFEAYYSDRIRLYGRETHSCLITQQVTYSLDGRDVAYENWQLYTPPPLGQMPIKKVSREQLEEIYPSKSKVERWQWIFWSANSSHLTTQSWYTKEEAQENAQTMNCKVICKDPNCIKPLITEE